MGRSQKALGKLIGLDIGGTKIEGILWAQNQVLQSKVIPTPKNPARFLKSVFELIQDLKVKNKISGIGIAIAGAIDKDKGSIVSSPNLRSIKNLALVKILERKFGKPVMIDNDTNCFLLAEHRFGVARGQKNVMALTIGTGVGGAVLTDGKMLRGAHVSAVELGHVVLYKIKHQFFTLEDLISSHKFQKLHVSDPKALQDRGLHGDKQARGIYSEIGEFLGVGLASFVNIFDPEMIVLGGGISRAHKLFLPRTLVVMRQYTLGSIKKLPPIKISKLSHAGALGAVSLFI